MAKRILSLTVNGRRREDAVADHTLLLDYLREALQLTGTKRGCDGGECGACTVLVDGAPQLACITLAARCDGRQRRNDRGARDRRPHEPAAGGVSREARDAVRLLHAGNDHGGRSAAAHGTPAPTEAEIRDALSGNLCRCTGYVKIIESVQAAVDADAREADR